MFGLLLNVAAFLCEWPFVLSLLLVCHFVRLNGRGEQPWVRKK